MRFLSLVLASLFLVSGRGFGAPEALKKERLDLHLGNIESEARGQRYLGGAFLLGGGLLAGAGALIARNSDDPDTRSTGAVVLGVTGGVFVVAGVMVLFLPSDFEKLPQAYAALPSNGPELMHAKVLIGEDYLRQLGERARKQRIISSLVGIGAGAAYITIGASSSSSSQRDWMIYSGAAIAALGIADLLTERKAETEYKAYDSWRSHAGAFVPSSLRFGIVPTPQGAVGALSLRF